MKITEFEDLTVVRLEKLEAENKALSTRLEQLYGIASIDAVHQLKELTERLANLEDPNTWRLKMARRKNNMEENIFSILFFCVVALSMLVATAAVLVGIIIGIIHLAALYGSWCLALLIPLVATPIAVGIKYGK